VTAVLQSLVIDTVNDHNTRETGARVARMYLNELFAGRYAGSPDLTAFPNVNSYDELYLVGPITIRSTCAHHLQNIRGNCWIGIYPGKNVLGLSKFYRLAEWIAARPQIQEEMTIQIADLLEAETSPDGIAVVVKAEHMCVTHRGVREHASGHDDVRAARHPSRPARHPRRILPPAARNEGVRLLTQSVLDGRVPGPRLTPVALPALPFAPVLVRTVLRARDRRDDARRCGDRRRAPLRQPPLRCGRKRRNDDAGRRAHRRSARPHPALDCGALPGSIAHSSWIVPVADWNHSVHVSGCRAMS
jgi:GTP cyclohydrolase I